MCARLVAAVEADDAAVVVLVESSENSAARATLISEGEARTNFRRRCVTRIIFCALAVLGMTVPVAADDAVGRALFILPPYLPFRVPPLVLAAASPMLPREGDRISEYLSDGRTVSFV